MPFPSSLLIPTLTITTLGVLILGGAMMDGNSLSEGNAENTSFTTQSDPAPTVVMGNSSVSSSPINTGTCTIDQIPACKKWFWKDFDVKTCKEVTFAVDCMFYDEVSTDKTEYEELLRDYDLEGREAGNVACDTQLIDTITKYGNACEESELGKTKYDRNILGMCANNTLTCTRVTKDGKQLYLRQKHPNRYTPAGKPEICDGRDNDCDGQIDEGYQQKEYLRDFDGDGRGNIDMKTKACLAPPGHVLKAGDCDDLDKTINPGASEVCDAKDNNCNRQIDEYLVDCNEEMKECKVKLPLGGNGDLRGNDVSVSEGDAGWGENDTTTSIETSTQSQIEMIKELINKIIILFPEHKDDILNLFTEFKIESINYLFIRYGSYKNKPYAQEMLNNAAEINPYNAIENYKFYNDLPYAQEIFKTAVFSLLNQDFPSGAFIFFKYYKDQPYAPIILEGAIKIDPVAALEYFKKYKDYTDPEELQKIIQIIGEKAGGFILGHLIGKAGDDNNTKRYIKIVNEFKDGIGPDQWKSLLTIIIANLENRTDLFFYKDRIPTTPEFESLHKYFQDIISNFTTLKIGNKTIKLEYPKHLNLYTGLIKTYNQLKKSGLNTDPITIKKTYEANLTRFISTGIHFSSNSKLNTFVVRADEAGGDDDNGIFTIFNDDMIELYQCLGKQGTCTIIRSNEKTLTPDEIIALFAKQIHDNPDGYHLFHLGGHGGTDGSLKLAGGVWTKEKFDKLFNLQVAYPGRIRIDITSCNSYWKDDNRKNNTIRNISLDSSQQNAKLLAEILLQEAFVKKNTQGKKNFEADYDSDGVVNYHEALIYRAINYNQSITPIMFDDNGKIIDIVDADIIPQDIQDRSDRENDPFLDTQCSLDC